MTPDRLERSRKVTRNIRVPRPCMCPLCLDLRARNEEVERQAALPEVIL